MHHQCKCDTSRAWTLFRPHQRHVRGFGTQILGDTGFRVGLLMPAIRNKDNSACFDPVMIPPLPPAGSLAPFLLLRTVTSATNGALFCVLCLRPAGANSCPFPPSHRCRDNFCEGAHRRTLTTSRSSSDHHLTMALTPLWGLSTDLCRHHLAPGVGGFRSQGGG